MSDTKAPDYKSGLAQLETTLEDFFGKKAPALPENVKDSLVSFAPYLAIIGVIISVAGLLPLLGLGAMMGPWAASFGITYYVGAVGIVISAIFDGLAVSGLFKKSLSAWRLLFYGSLVNAVASVIQGNIVGALLGAAISLYFLFQVKSKYK